MKKLLLLITCFIFVTSAAADSIIIKGPYLQNVNKTSITIMWETNESSPSRVDYGPNEIYGSFSSNATSVSIHEVVLTGLTEETLYHYNVTSGVASSTDSTFQTAVATTTPFRFVAYGDTRTYPVDHSAVIAGIIASAPNIVLHSGDIVADGTVYSQWKTQFFDPAADLIRNKTMFLALGNHERNASWYYDYFSNPRTSTTEAWYSFDYGNAHFIALDTDHDFDPGSTQYDWLVNDLNSSAAQSANWTFVFFHHPPYTSGTHGVPEQRGVDARTYLVPLFETYGVDIVFNGHDHIYERSYKDGVYYIVTGGGGAPLRDLNETVNPYQQLALSVLHHCTVDINGASLAFNARYNNGTAFDSFSITQASCGDSLTSDKTLTSNLTCNGTAFYIDANDITLDCNGFTLTGDGSEYGVYASNRNNVTVRNCALRNFEEGIHINSTGNSTLDNNTLTNNSEWGIRLVAYSNNNIIRNNNASGNDNGIYIYLSHNNTLENNTANDNTGLNAIRLQFSDNNTLIGNTVRDNAGWGIMLYTANNNTLTNNTVIGNAVGLYLSNSGNNSVVDNTACNNTPDIHLDSQALNNSGGNTCNNITDDDSNNVYCSWDCVNPRCGTTLTADTTLSRNYSCNGTALFIGANDVTLNCDGSSIVGDGTYNGVEVIDRSGVTVANCTFSNFQDGILLISSNNSNVVSNVARNNSQCGIFLFNWSDYNTVSSNEVSHNAYGVCVGNSSDNTLQGNIAHNNTGAGLYLYGGSANNTVYGNTANNNSETGIAITGASYNNVTANTGDYNLGMGILTDNLSTGNVLNGNRFCNNNQTTVPGAFYDIYDLGSSTGDDNTCNTTLNYTDTSAASGCANACTSIQSIVMVVGWNLISISLI